MTLSDPRGSFVEGIRTKCTQPPKVMRTEHRRDNGPPGQSEPRKERERLAGNGDDKDREQVNNSSRQRAGETVGSCEPGQLKGRGS